MKNIFIIILFTMIANNMYATNQFDEVIAEESDNIVYQNIHKDWKDTIELFNEYHQYSDNEYMKLRLKNA